MDTMKACGFQAEETAEEAVAAANAALLERDGFSVEDLLDLEEFDEPDKDCADHDDAPPPPAAATEDTEKDKSPDDSQSLSVVTHQLPAPPQPEMVDLPVSIRGPSDPSIRGKTAAFAGLRSRPVSEKRVIYAAFCFVLLAGA
jgi:hypothetical protein